MTQREQIEALREELAEIRKQLSAMAVAMVELAAKQPVTFYYYPNPSLPVNPWPPLKPYITYTSGESLPVPSHAGIYS